jgi:predicted DNA-binding transcriptional regulator YafY
MAKNYFKRYIWLIDVISRHGHITSREINDLWYRSPINELSQKKIPERTFHNHIDSIFDLFGVEIKCDRSLGYYIANSEDIGGDGLRQWMLSSLSLNNLLNESAGVRDCILFENVPSSEKYLTAIMEAIRDHKAIEIRYKGFNRKAAARFEAEPYCLRQFKQRWYMVAKTAASDTPWIYGLDRIESLEKTDRSYSIPKKFSAEGYFRDLYGACIGNGQPAEDVRIRVRKSQVEYFKSLKLHHSQKLVSEDENGAEFSYRLVPTYDFEQELLSKMGNVEVLAPQWLRDEMKGIIEDMMSNYEK